MPRRSPVVAPDVWASLTDAKDVPWLQPIPDTLLELPDPDPATDPAASMMRRVSSRLAEAESGLNALAEELCSSIKAALSGRYRRARRAAVVFAAGVARPGGGLKTALFVRTSPSPPGTFNHDQDHQADQLSRRPPRPPP